MAATAKRPFWMHQLVEYILGGAMAASGLRSPTPAVPAVLGTLIMLHAAMTIAPLGAFRIIKRGLHRAIDLVLIAVEILAAVQPWIHLDSATRGIVLAIAIVQLFVWWNTNFAMRIKSPAMSAEGGRSTQVGRIAGRLVGNGVNAVRRHRGDDR